MASEPRARPTVKPELAQASPREQVTRSIARPAPFVLDSVVSEPLRVVIEQEPSALIGVVIELRTVAGVGPARRSLARLVTAVTGGRETVPTGLSPYVTVALTAAEIAELATRAARPAQRTAAGRGTAAPSRATVAPSAPAPRSVIQRMWPNFEITGQLLRSVVATKCRAAQRTFDASGEGIVWAVLDSGIDRRHRHFAAHRNLELAEGLAHRSFVPEVTDPLADGNGHGTHVAGIIAGGLAPDESAIGVGWYLDADGVEHRQALPVPGITGMAPAAKLLSCTVLRPDRTGDLTALIDALLYIDELNDGGRRIRVHGVNISVGHLFDPRWYAAGLTPVCKEVDRLVASGVVVVVAAGNTGYGYAKDPDGRTMRLGFAMTINDPGNAARAITVGATSSSPHTTGVSFFSSKGPTGDGRMKPDLVAPGERVISAAAGLLRDQAREADENADYIESTGTSMAAPHVSGAAAGLLSVHREFIGDAERVKALLCSAATDLGRAREFQGAGMVDAMRALQAT